MLIFLLYIILLAILNFVAIKTMQINADKSIWGDVTLYKVEVFQYIIGIFLIITSKVIFDVKFHKIQKSLERNL